MGLIHPFYGEWHLSRLLHGVARHVLAMETRLIMLLHFYHGGAEIKKRCIVINKDSPAK